MKLSVPANTFLSPHILSFGVDHCWTKALVPTPIFDTLSIADVKDGVSLVKRASFRNQVVKAPQKQTADALDRTLGPFRPFGLAFGHRRKDALVHRTFRRPPCTDWTAVPLFAGGLEVRYSFPLLALL